MPASSAPAVSPAEERLLPPLAGARAMAPWLLGIAPLGLVVGVSVAKADIPPMAGWLAGPLIFGGSAQVAAVQLVDSGAPAAVAIAAALAVHVRLVLYSATMAGHWRGAPRWWQAVAAWMLIEPTLSVGVDGYERAVTPRQGHLHYMGGAVTLLAAWLAATTLGATLGTVLPEALRLELAIPLFLVGQVVPRLTTPAARRAAGVAAGLGVIGTWAPLHLGALLAIGGGLVAAQLASGPGGAER